MKLTAKDGKPVVEVEPEPRAYLALQDASLDTGPHLGRMLEVAGKRLENYGTGTHVHDLACQAAECGASWNTRTETPALRFVGGSIPDNPPYLTCTVCNAWRAKASELGGVLWPRGRGRVYAEWFGVTQLKYQRFIAVRTKGGKSSLGTNFTDIALSVVPKVYNPLEDIEAVIILAHSRPLAVEAMLLPTVTDAYVTVPCTPQCEPLNEWHGLPLNATERASLDRVQLAEKRRQQSAINAEIERLRRQRLAEL